MEFTRNQAVAMNVGWKLSVSPTAVRFRIATGLCGFFLLFFAVGAGLLIVPFVPGNSSSWVSAVIGALFVIGGAVAFFGVRKQKFPEFDLVRENFYPEGRARSVRELSGGEENLIPFREMRGFRMTSHIVGSGRNSHRVFELELLCSGDRSFLLLHHSDLAAFCRDALALSRALHLPLPAPEWDWRAGLDSRRRGAITLIVIGVFFFGISSVFNYFIWIQGALAMRRAGDWVKVPATVRSSAVKRSGSGKKASYRFEVDYQYRFGERTFSGSACDFWSNVNGGRGEAEALQRQYPAGSSCFCWVNPAAPNEAVLSKSWPSRITLMALFIGLFHLVGAGIVVAGVRQLVRKIPDLSGGASVLSREEERLS